MYNIEKRTRKFVRKHAILYKILNFAIYNSRDYIKLELFKILFSKTIIVNLYGKREKLRQVKIKYLNKRTNKNIYIAGYNFREVYLAAFEVFKEKEYNFLDVKGKQVVDIGGFDGDTAILFALNGAKKVFVYEANPRLIPLIKYNIKSNIKANKRKCIMIFNAFVDSSKGYKGTLFIDNQNMVNSIKDDQRSSMKIKIIKKTLNQITQSNDIKGGMLKMDVEGAEYSIIKGASLNTLKKYSKIQIDFHKHGYTDIVMKLEKAGFNCTITPKTKNRQSGYITGTSLNKI